MAAVNTALQRFHLVTEVKYPCSSLVSLNVINVFPKAVISYIDVALCQERVTLAFSLFNYLFYLGKQIAEYNFC